MPRDAVVTEFFRSAPVRSRLRYVALTCAVVLAGLFWRSGVIPLPPLVSNHGGDALWALMVFFGFGAIFFRAPTYVIALLAVTFAWTVEFSQLHQAPWLDAIRATVAGKLVLGNAFHWVDLAAYLMGIALGVLAERVLDSRSKAANE